MGIQDMVTEGAANLAMGGEYRHCGGLAILCGIEHLMQVMDISIGQT